MNNWWYVLNFHFKNYFHKYNSVESALPIADEEDPLNVNVNEDINVNMNFERELRIFTNGFTNAIPPIIRENNLLLDRSRTKNNYKCKSFNNKGGLVTDYFICMWGSWVIYFHKKICWPSCVSKYLSDFNRKKRGALY